MKITSAEVICWISNETNGERRRFTGFDVVAHVDLSHGQFEARNRNVHFLNLKAFVATLDQFIMDRSLTPRLEGTYDTYVGFFAKDNSVICVYRVGDAFCGRETATFHQSGEFEIEQEKLLEFLSGFQKLSDQQRL